MTLFDGLNASIQPMEEARSLVVEFEMLEETLIQQLRATFLTLFILVTLLIALTLIFIAAGDGAREQWQVIAPLGVVIAFGLVSTSAIYFRLKASLKNTFRARIFLERNLIDSDFEVVRTVSGGPSQRGEETYV